MWTIANRLYVKSGGACNSGHLEKRKVNFSLQNEKAPDIIARNRSKVGMVRHIELFCIFIPNV